jgi:anti-sigma-K factor RskA
MEAGIHELSAGYALDALDPSEREEFERHLAECETCQEDLASFWEVTSALAVAANGPKPPPALRDRILEAARAERPTVVPFEPRRRRLQTSLAAAAAIAAVVAIGLGVYAFSLDQRLDDTRSALSTQEHVAAVLADPNATSVSMAAGTGRLVVAGNGSAVLVLDDLSTVPSGKTYQAWVVEGKTPVPAGTFDERGGHAVVPIPQRVPDGAVVAVTIEDEGGARTPTLPILAASKPV